MSLEKVIEILRDADIETVGCRGIETRIDNINELAERIVKLFAIPVVSQCLPNDEKMHDDLLDIIDKNLSCGTGQEAGILCNRFATTSFIIDYIKKLLVNCG